MLYGKNHTLKMSHKIVNNYGLSTNYVLINSSKCETVSSA